MERERTGPDIERASHLFGAARAEVEELRASDRLQRIFQSDMGQGRRGRFLGAAEGQTAPGPAPERAGDVHETAASDGRRLFSSRRVRVLVGLCPVYLAMVVLAVEGVRALRDEPKRVAFVSADGPARPALEAEPRSAFGADLSEGERAEPDPIGGARVAPSGGESPASLPRRPESSGMPVPRPAELVTAQRNAAPRGGKASEDVAKAIEGRQVAAQRADRLPVGGSTAERGQAAAGQSPSVPAAAAAPPALAGGATEAPESGGVGAAAGKVSVAPVGAGKPAALDSWATRAATPPTPRPQAGTTTGGSVSRVTSGVAGGGSTSAEGVAEGDVATGAEANRLAGGERQRTVPAVAKQARPDTAVIGLPPDTSETVPQATWSSRDAAPVPPPAPRFARLSEVLAQRGASKDEADLAPSLARPTLRRAPESGAPQREAHVATSSTGSPTNGSVPQSGSAPPRIVVHYRRGAGPAAARRVASELLARGYVRTELRPVPFAISRANVRYFHDHNRPVARKVNELVEATGRRSELRDFTHYAPLPSVGTVEVWLPG